MKTQSSKPIMLFLLLVLTGLTLVTYIRRPQSSPAEALRLIPVLQKFARDQDQRGHFPALVRIDELVSAGYLTTKEARHFAGADISFSVPAPDHNPRQILISLNLRDGRQVWLLGDGSLQQLSPQ